MIPELGHFALVVALCVALFQFVVPLIGALRQDQALIAVARPAAWTQFLLLLFSFICLSHAFLNNDFSVQYVAMHSNSQLPQWFKFSAVWGGHEGSLLLWALILSIWGAAVAIYSRGLPDDVVAIVLSVMGVIAIGFLSFILFTSNPFDRLLPVFPLDGNDLNPLLQDIGLVIHPPMLYMGYVGFSVAFSFAIAGLVTGRLDTAWARWTRPWTLMAWCFMTLGIALGSWWAYYELGWGGWWFWDPVENASFMPWLVGTALVHSLAVTEKRGVFKWWTVLLAIAAFSLSLLGTFLVRSGVLTSVHAFATDPERGAFILAYLFVVVGGSLLLFAFRANVLRTSNHYSLSSRESMLAFNNLILLTATSTVLLGTLFPLITEALDLGKLSVGPPYFNLLFMPLTFLILIAMALGPYFRWKEQEFLPLLSSLKWIAVASVGIGVLLPLAFFGRYESVRVFLASVLSGWVALALLRHASQHAQVKRHGLLKGFVRLPRSYKGMMLAHWGFVVAVIGVTFTSFYSTEKDVRLNVNESLVVEQYEFVFKGVQEHQGANYRAVIGRVDVFEDGELSVRLMPEKRFYLVQQNSMTEAAIDAGLFRDLYVALGEPLGDGSWAVRIYHKPFVRWIWLGALLIAMGGGLCVMDPRYRMAKRSASLKAKAGWSGAAQS